MPTRRQDHDDSVSFREDDETLAALFGGRAARTESRLSRRMRGLLAFLVAVALLAGLAVAVKRLTDRIQPVRLAPEACVATANGRSVVLDHDQMHHAALIAGVAVREGTGERGAAIAIATALQESSLHNLAGGDRDSVGLFQQRPSQGWGTVAQIRDPFYATETFLAAMKKVDWESGSINDVAQAVQRSGVPDGYTKREPDAMVLAAVFTGDVADGLSCLDRQHLPSNPAGFVAEFNQTWGVKASPSGAELLVRGRDDDIARAFAMFAVANMREYGVVRVDLGDRTWSPDDAKQGAWLPGQATGLETTQVRITFRT